MFDQMKHILGLCLIFTEHCALWPTELENYLIWCEIKKNVYWLRLYQIRELEALLLTPVVGVVKGPIFDSWSWRGKNGKKAIFLSPVVGGVRGHIF